MINTKKAKDIIDDVNEQGDNAKENLNHMYHQAKDVAYNIYEESKKKMEDAENYICMHSNDLVKKIKDKPLSSIVIAAGIGYLLSSLFKK